jgi:hypothetical protein
MEKQEFNLSDRAKNMPIETEWKKYAEDDYEPIAWEYKPFYKEEDVKEFIKRLKQKINPDNKCFDEFCCPSCMNKRIYLKEIDKLAGKELI